MCESRKKEQLTIMRKVFIIAEAGVNHNGSLEMAKEMIDIAAESGADAIKFQTFISENCITEGAAKPQYQKETTDIHQSQLEMVKKLELSFDDFIELKKYCEKKDIMFLSTAFDVESVEFLNNIGLDIFKIPSGEITNVPLLRTIGKLKKKVIMSTGMCTIEEVTTAINILKQQGTEDIILLHCNTQYPTPMEDVNLNAMQTLKNEFHYAVGYSDHSLGIEVPIAAVALGACVIEKHFTLDKKMEGPDHKASVDPNELVQMVKGIRNIEKAMGTAEKKVTSSEVENVQLMRKSIVALTEIKKGEVYTEKNITVKRPGTGISAIEWDSVLGKKANRDYMADEMIERE